MRGHIARMAFIVWSTPHADVGDEYHRWYNEVHLPDAIENGSFVAMHRYEAVGPGYRRGTVPVDRGGRLRRRSRGVGGGAPTRAGAA